MTVLASIMREQHDARATGYKRIVHIRVTTDALPGSVTSLPVTPERARVIGRLLAVQDLGVVADPNSTETLLELLIHPADWAELLTDDDKYRAVQIGPDTRVIGIPVST